MDLALAEAAKALGMGEVPVGAVVVSGRGEVLGTGHNTPESGVDPTAHAEIAAIREAARKTGNYRLGGSVLVCTLEPCLMCVGAMLQARISGLVYGAMDAKAGAVKSRMQALDEPWLNHQIWHLDRILEEECSSQLSAFFTAKRMVKNRQEV